MAAYEGQYVQTILSEVQERSVEVGVVSSDPGATLEERERARKDLELYIKAHEDTIEQVPGLAESISSISEAAIEQASHHVWFSRSTCHAASYQYYRRFYI